jgi:hypothetical protein
MRSTDSGETLPRRWPSRSATWRSARPGFRPLRRCGLGTDGSPRAPTGPRQAWNGRRFWPSWGWTRAGAAYVRPPVAPPRRWLSDHAAWVGTAITSPDSDHRRQLTLRSARRDGEELPTSFDAFQRLGPPVLQGDVGAHDQVAHGPGGQDLTGPRCFHHPRRDVHRDTADITVAQLDLADVQPRPKLERKAAKLISERRRTPDPTAGTVEGWPGSHRRLS